jgi:hypothetical protein
VFENKPYIFVVNCEGQTFTRVIFPHTKLQAENELPISDYNNAYYDQLMNASYTPEIQQSDADFIKELQIAQIAQNGKFSWDGTLTVEKPYLSW